jgi:GST-like protein
MNERYTLYGSKGCGSAPVEAVLGMLELPFDYIEAPPWEPGPHIEALRRHNPLLQVPTLVLPDGGVMSESAAILLYLSREAPGAPLLPATPRARAALYRWTVFIAANIYAAVGTGDFPERWVTGETAQKSLKEKCAERTLVYWKMMEDALSPSPYLLGEKISVLDVYASAVSRWRPGRKAIAAACPRLASVFELTERRPIVNEVWSRNFGG